MPNPEISDISHQNSSGPDAQVPDFADVLSSFGVRGGARVMGALSRLTPAEVLKFLSDGQSDKK